MWSVVSDRVVHSQRVPVGEQEPYGVRHRGEPLDDIERVESSNGQSVQLRQSAQGQARPQELAGRCPGHGRHSDTTRLVHVD